MQDFENLFPFNEGLDNFLVPRREQFINSIIKQPGKYTINEIENLFRTRFNNYKLTIKLDKNYVPIVEIYDEPMPQVRHGKLAFEFQSLRFEFNGEYELFNYSSNEYCDIEGIIDEDGYLYIGIRYQHDIPEENKPIEVKNQLEKAHKSISSSINKQSNEIDKFINANWPYVQNKIASYVKQIQVSDKLNNDVRNIISGLDM